MVQVLLLLTSMSWDYCLKHILNTIVSPKGRKQPDRDVQQLRDLVPSRKRKLYFA